MLCLGLWLWVSSTQAQTPPTELDEEGTVFFYRRGSFYSTNFLVHLNGQLVTKYFPGRTYFFVKVPPGTLHLRTSGYPAYYVTEKTFQLEVKPGKTYYLEAVPDVDFVSSALYLVQRDEADFKRRTKRMTWNENAKSVLD